MMREVRKLDTINIYIYILYIYILQKCSACGGAADNMILKSGSFYLCEGVFLIILTLDNFI